MYRSVGRPKLRSEDDIKMNLEAIEWDGVDWMHLIQNEDQWRVLVSMKALNPSIIVICWEYL